MDENTTSMDFRKLGERIRKQRKLAELTQAQLAEMAGISVPFMGLIERGERSASLETLINIANALDVSTDLLLQDYLTTDYAKHHIYPPAVTNLLRDLHSELSQINYIIDDQE